MSPEFTLLRPRYVDPLRDLVNAVHVCDPCGYFEYFTFTPKHGKVRPAGFEFAHDRALVRGGLNIAQAEENMAIAREEGF